MDNKEFTRIIDETKAIVLSAIERNLAERFVHALDDVVQETYLRAYSSLVKKKFKEQSKLSTWLYTIAKNEALRMNDKLLREERKQKKLENSISNQFLSEREHYLFEKHWLRLLPEKYAQVISLLIEGYSEKEISLELSIPRGTVKSRIFRAKAQLQEIVTKEENL